MITEKDIGKTVYRINDEITYEGILRKVSHEAVAVDWNGNKDQYFSRTRCGEWFVKKEKDKNKMKEFYILWHPDSPNSPTRKFETQKQAEIVAEKMMQRIGDGQMYVMKSIGSCKVNKVQWEKV